METSRVTYPTISLSEDTFALCPAIYRKTVKKQSDGSMTMCHPPLALVRLELGPGLGPSTSCDNRNKLPTCEEETGPRFPNSSRLGAAWMSKSCYAHSSNSFG
jgi:hypothetical protein